MVLYVDINFFVTFFTLSSSELSWDWPSTWLTNHYPSVLWHCWLGHLTCKIVSTMTYNVPSGMLNLTKVQHTSYDVYMALWIMVWVWSVGELAVCATVSDWPRLRRPWQHFAGRRHARFISRPVYCKLRQWLTILLLLMTSTHLVLLRRAWRSCGISWIRMYQWRESE